MIPHDRIRGKRRRFLRTTRVGCAAVALALAAACSQQSGTPDPHSTPRTGGKLTMLLPGDARGLDPFTASASNVADGSRLSALYDVLVWSDPSTGTVRPQMAESLSPDKDASVWTLRLRPDIKFSDGADLDAEAVRLAWDKHKDPALRSLASITVATMQTSVVSKLELRIQLASPNGNFDRIVARMLNFVPSPRTLADVAASSKAPVGAGPFVFREWVPGSHMTFQRNPNYWQRGKPYLDEVTFRVNADSPAAPGIIDDGDADVTVSTDLLVIEAARERGLATGEVPLNGGLMVVFNMRTGQRGSVFSNPDLRRAVVLSLSSMDIDQRFYGGKGSPARGIFDSTSPLANVQLVSPENNPAEAAELFAKVTANGRNKLAFSYVVPNNPKAKAIAEHIKQRVESVSGGAVTVNVEAEDIPVFIQRTSIENRFAMATFQLWADDPEPSLYQFLHSKAMFTNVTGYANAEVDAALEGARLATEQSTRSALYTRVQVRLNTDLPFFVYQEAVAAYVSADKVTGLELFNDGVLLFDRIGLRK